MRWAARLPFPGFELDPEHVALSDDGLHATDSGSSSALRWTFEPVSTAHARVSDQSGRTRPLGFTSMQRRPIEIATTVGQVGHAFMRIGGVLMSNGGPFQVLEGQPARHLGRGLSACQAGRRFLGALDVVGTLVTQLDYTCSRRLSPLLGSGGSLLGGNGCLVTPARNQLKTLCRC